MLILHYTSWIAINFTSLTGLKGANFKQCAMKVVLSLCGHLYMVLQYLTITGGVPLEELLTGYSKPAGICALVRLLALCALAKEGLV